MWIVRPLPVRSGFFVMTTADLKRDAERIPSLLSGKGTKKCINLKAG